MVTRTLTNIGDPIKTPDGITKEGLEVTFQLVDAAARQPVTLFDAAEGGGELIVGDIITVTTDEVGHFTVDLWPNNRGEIATLYKVRLPAGVAGGPAKPFFIRVTEGGDDLTLLAAKAAMEAVQPQTLSLFDALLASIMDVVGTVTAVASETVNGLMASIDKVRLNLLWGEVVYAGAYTTLQAADDVAVSLGKTLRISQVWGVVPATLNAPLVQTVPGGKLDASNTVNIVNRFEGCYNCFGANQNVTGLSYAEMEFFGGKADWTGSAGTDSGGALLKALASLKSGGELGVRLGRYYSAQRIVTPIGKSIKIKGALQPSISDVTIGSSITFGAGVHGLRLLGTGSQLEDLAFIGGDGGFVSGATIGYECWGAKQQVRNVTFRNWGGDGYLVDSTSPAWSSAAGYITSDFVTHGGKTYQAVAPSTNITPGTNTAVWVETLKNLNLHRSYDVQVYHNGGRGIAVKGSDSNAHIFQGFNCTANLLTQLDSQGSRNSFQGHIDASNIGARAIYDNNMSNDYNVYVESSLLHPWDAGTGYIAFDYVLYGGNSYYALIGTLASPLTGVTPGSDPAKWQLAATGVPAGVDGTGAAVGGKDFELGTTSTMGSLKALYYAMPVVTGSVTAISSWDIYERYSQRQLVLADRNNGIGTGKQWKFLNGISSSGTMQWSVSNPDGSSSVDALKITGDGARYITTATIEPATTGTRDLGTTSARWRDLHLSRGLGVFGTIPITAKPTVTGSKGGNAAMTSLLTALASYGLITDSTT